MKRYSEKELEMIKAVIEGAIATCYDCQKKLFDNSKNLEKDDNVVSWEEVIKVVATAYILVFRLKLGLRHLFSYYPMLYVIFLVASGLFRKMFQEEKKGDIEEMLSKLGSLIREEVEHWKEAMKTVGDNMGNDMKLILLFSSQVLLSIIEAELEGKEPKFVILPIPTKDLKFFLEEGEPDLSIKFH